MLPLLSETLGVSALCLGCLVEFFDDLLLLRDLGREVEDEKSVGSLLVSSIGGDGGHG